MLKNNKGSITGYLCLFIVIAFFLNFSFSQNKYITNKISIKICKKINNYHLVNYILNYALINKLNNSNITINNINYNYNITKKNNTYVTSINYKNKTDIFSCIKEGNSYRIIKN